jgi:hypothetical protein
VATQIFRVLVISVLVVAMSFVLIHRTPASAGGRFQEDLTDGAERSAEGSYVYEHSGGAVRCRPANVAEVRFLSDYNEDLPLQEISDEGLALQAGAIDIVLRGTPQLDNFPQAKAAFIKAADAVETRIQASQPISVVIDVDFGETFFGQPYPGDRVVGLARGQLLGLEYPAFRTALIGSAATANELGLYQSLPQGSVPTDIGNTSRVFVQTPVLRSLGLISPIADPNGELGQFGPPPAIGFNSRFAFDFNQDDGISRDLVDYVAVAIHEILHALGFGSLVGRRELDPSTTLAVTPLDLCRFRPGAVTEARAELASFTDAQRILRSGGNQVFFAGGAELPLSTGRPDGSGGDGFQASHWQDNTLAGRTIGIMDPQTSPGELGVITDSDLKAMDVIGYGLGAAGGDPGGPVINSANYNGAALIVKATGVSGDLQLLVNDSVVAPPRKIKIKGGGAKLKIPGTPEQLNLRNGANLVQLVRDGVRSNVFVMSL